MHILQKNDFTVEVGAVLLENEGGDCNQSSVNKNDDAAVRDYSAGAPPEWESYQSDKVNSVYSLCN